MGSREFLNLRKARHVEALIITNAHILILGSMQNYSTGYATRRRNDVGNYLGSYITKSLYISPVFMSFSIFFPI